LRKTKPSMVTVYASFPRARGRCAIRSVSSLALNVTDLAKRREAEAASAQTNSIPCFGPAPTMRVINASVGLELSSELYQQSTSLATRVGQAFWRPS
jgi:hypothetical protein